MDAKNTHQSKEFFHVKSSDVAVLSRQGRRLAKLVLQSRELEASMEQVVEQVIHQAERKPANIDSLLVIYLALTEELGSNITRAQVNGTVVGTQSGKSASIEFLNTKLHERLATFIEATGARRPWGASGRTHDTLDHARKTMTRILAYSEIRRSVITLQALRGRAMALGLYSTDETAEIPTTFSLVRNPISLLGQGDATDDTQSIGEIVFVLAAGHFFADGQITYLEHIKCILEEKLCLPISFRERYLIARAMKSLNNGWKPCTSADLFGETNWIG